MLFSAGLERSERKVSGRKLQSNLFDTLRTLLPGNRLCKIMKYQDKDCTKIKKMFSSNLVTSYSQRNDAKERKLFQINTQEDE